MGLLFLLENKPVTKVGASHAGRMRCCLRRADSPELQHGRGRAGLAAAGNERSGWAKGRGVVS
ncbi:hypothetical protein C1O66_05670 [Paucibacter aquatile]|uniref:Uncharacterized protein n=1 Tax=Kinneretia aquatilis TaxID=2070761 RepID=A0A2N8KUD6_9BURK|nr:hypothetical protein C1O66_05670 [Paucibacter aquatile]